LFLQGFRPGPLSAIGGSCVLPRIRGHGTLVRSWLIPPPATRTSPGRPSTTLLA